MIFPEYAMDVADACRARGIKTVAVTAGYICAEPRREFYAKMDAANVDLKAFTEDFYQQGRRGAPRSRCSTRSRYLVHETDVWFEITTLLIPGQNDSDAELDAAGGVGRRATSGPTCRSTSPRSTPTTRCWTSRRRRPRRCARARDDRAAERPALRLHGQRPRP